jgi:putative acetyltransferase
MRIERGDLDDPETVALIQAHVTRAVAATEPGSAHALDVSALKAPEIDFWTVRDDDGALIAVGALKRLTADHGELKSMHVAETRRRTGAGRALIEHLIADARRQGLTRLSLETGSWAYFESARAFYARHGFEVCGPFLGYVTDRNSVFMTLSL